MFGSPHKVKPVFRIMKVDGVFWIEEIIRYHPEGRPSVTYLRLTHRGQSIDAFVPSKLARTIDHLPIPSRVYLQATVEKHGHAADINVLRALID